MREFGQGYRALNVRKTMTVRIQPVLDRAKANAVLNLVF